MVPEANARLVPPGNYILLLRPSMPVQVWWWDRIERALREFIGDRRLPASRRAVIIRLETPGEMIGVSSPPSIPLIRVLRAELGYILILRSKALTFSS